ncbi:MAG TPA: ribonuclease III [Firmicutes bacterium]|jgi:ribonuclease-3|nr:ribonuclease III [Bacillota bacterium]
MLTGIPIKDQGLLRQALTHTSYSNEHRDAGVKANERLEFLGDAVLGLVVSDYLYQHYPHLAEGQLTELRARAVCESSLARQARQLGLGSMLRLGKGEEAAGGRNRPSLLADAFEAVVGAVYFEGGFQTARDFIVRQLGNILQGNRPGTGSNFKSALQEYVQGKGGNAPVYRTVKESGPDHARHYVVAVEVDGREVGRGSGRRKQEAEQAAARQALERLRRSKGP